MNINRKEQIIQTAAKLFREKGYHSVSMRDLASELGIKAASLYNHIQSKEDILAEIIMDLAENFTEHVQKVLIEETTIVDKLREIIEMHIETTLHKTDYLACMNKEWKHLGENQQQVFLELRENYERIFLELVKTGMQNGELHERDPQITTFAMLSTLRTIYHWLDPNNDEKIQMLKNTIVENLLFGVVAKR